MKKIIQTNARLLGAALLGTTLLAGAAARADVVTQTVDQTAGTTGDWNSAIWGTPADISRSTNSYVAPLAVRTGNSTTPAAFAGQSLTIDSTGVLFLKHTLGVASVNLILNGGFMTFHGGPSADSCPVGGTLSVIADSTIRSDQGTANNRDIRLLSSISGSGGLIVDMGAAPTLGNALVLLGTNSAYNGNWNNLSGRIEIASGSSNALGSGTVTLTQTLFPLTFNSTNDFTITNSIDGGGSVVKLNTNTVTLSGLNTFSGTNEVRVGVLKLGAASATDNASVIALTGGTLDASVIGGLVLNAGISQNLNCRGTVVGNLTAGAGTALNFNLSAAANDVLNVTGSLTLNGTPTLNLALAGYKTAGTYTLINYSGTILGGGTFALVPPVGSVQTFSLDYSTAGQVNLVIVGDPKDLIWLGDGGANYWDTTSFNWTNGIVLTNFAQGDYVTFNDSGSSPVSLFEAVNPSRMKVHNTSLPYLFSGVVGITTDGTLTKAEANDLVFENTGNSFTGPVDIQAGLLSIGAGGITGSLGNPSSITNNGVLRVNLGAGSAAVTINAPISGSGAVDVTGGTTGVGGAIVSLTGTNSYTGLTTVGDECQLLFTKSSGLGSAAVGTTVLANGRLGITTVVGAMTLDEPLTLNGGGLTTGNNQGGALYVLGANNNITLTAPITIASDARVRIIDNNARMTFVNTVLGNNVGLRVSVGAQPSDAGALMTFSNTVSIGTGTLVKDGQGMAAFTTANNVAGSTIINEGSLLANGTFNGGPVAVNASGTVGGSGTILGAVTVGSAGTLAPGNAGIGTLTLSSTLSLNAAATTRMEINRTNAQNADVLVAGAIPMNGALTVVNTGPALAVGDSFHLFTGTLSGAFTATNLPALALANHSWSFSNFVSTGTITVISNVLPQLPLLITDIKRNPTNVVLTWNSYPGRLYTVDYSLGLAPAVWKTLKTDIPCSTVTNTTAAAVDTTGVSSGSNNTLVAYSMGQAAAQIQDPTNTMAAGPITAGPGLTLFNANANVTPAYASQPELQVSPPNGATTLALAYAASSWFTFNLTVGTNLTDLGLTSLSFNGARGGGAAPRGYGVYVTTPTTTDELVQGSTAFITQRNVWTAQNINLSGVASLQHLTNGQVVSFKIVIFCPAAANSAEYDDIVVKGNVTPRPVTDYESAGTLFLRMKQQP